MKKEILLGEGTATLNHGGYMVSMPPRARNIEIHVEIEAAARSPSDPNLEGISRRQASH